ncbi:MAG: lysophospholipase [Myxococcota bacterium]|nr:lysophospholipase [Myxococcota bacterium]
MLNSASTIINSTTVRSPSAMRLARVVLHTAYLLSDDLGTSLAERLFTSPRRHARPARERAILATGRRFTVDVVRRSPRWGGQRTRVAAWRWGLGPTVLLVHGWEGRASQLGSFVEPLVAAGLSVVAFDAPAHGDSVGSRLYLTDLADAIADVTAAVGPLHATIAHSFGAAAMLLAHARGGVDAPRNVMLSPNVLIDDAVTRFAGVVALPAADRVRFEEHLVAASGVNLAELTVDRLAAGRDAGLLVIHDPADREVAFRHGEILAATWPGARLHGTEGLGHRRILRDPSVIAQAVAFVRHGVAPPASDLVREVDRLLA